MQQSKRKNSQGSSNKGRGVVRIIGGTMRGRKIRFADGEGLRPTLDRIRETVFNWLVGEIANQQVLDLFAGSGALGFEAVSRGATNVTMVEKSIGAVKELRHNCRQLELAQAQVIHSSAEAFLKSNKQKFDLVFLDPPFGQSMLKRSFDLLLPHLSPSAIIYIEQEKSANEFKPESPWQQLKYKSTGRFSYALYQKLESEGI